MLAVRALRDSPAHRLRSRSRPLTLMRRHLRLPRLMRHRLPSPRVTIHRRTATTATIRWRMARMASIRRKATERVVSQPVTSPSPPGAVGIVAIAGMRLDLAQQRIVGVALVGAAIVGLAVGWRERRVEIEPSHEVRV